MRAPVVTAAVRSGAAETSSRVSEFQREPASIHSCCDEMLPALKIPDETDLSRCGSDASAADVEASARSRRRLHALNFKCNLQGGVTRGLGLISALVVVLEGLGGGGVLLVSGRDETKVGNDGVFKGCGLLEPL